MAAHAPPEPPKVKAAITPAQGGPARCASLPLSAALSDAERAGLSWELKKAAARLTDNLNGLSLPEVQRQSLTLTVRQFVVLSDALNENALLNCESSADLLRAAQRRTQRNNRWVLAIASFGFIGWGVAFALAARLLALAG